MKGVSLESTLTRNQSKGMTAILAANITGHELEINPGRILCKYLVHHTKVLETTFKNSILPVVQIVHGQYAKVSEELRT